MKNKYIIGLFLFGAVLTIIGTLFKITHLEFGAINGNILLTIGMLTEVIAGLFFIIKLFSNKNNDFLNK